MYTIIYWYKNLPLYTHSASIPKTIKEPIKKIIVGEKTINHSSRESKFLLLQKYTINGRVQLIPEPNKIEPLNNILANSLCKPIPPMQEIKIMMAEKIA